MLRASLAFLLPGCASPKEVDEDTPFNLTDTGESGAPVGCPDYTGIIDGARWSYRYTEAYGEREGVSGQWTNDTEVRADGTWQTVSAGEVESDGDVEPVDMVYDGYCDRSGSWATQFVMDMRGSEMTMEYREPLLTIPAGLEAGDSWVQEGTMLAYEFDGEITEYAFSYEIVAADAGMVERPAGTYAALSLSFDGAPSQLLGADVGELGDGSIIELVSYTR